ncbi:sodium-dependent neutral amino acid transporter B(0)AT1-like isoform X3 [Dendronephthya gigantea]|nr:sodium-dependent neutral amino acid transporter B(0)AT1-like isoform X3 [Dendronephthya gigantea]
MPSSKESIKQSESHGLIELNKLNGEANGTVAGEVPNDGEPPNKRDSWGGKLEFVLASLGLAVGGGNVWRFPYLCQRNGGGAFLIPFFTCMILEGFPLMILEYTIGQRFRTTAVSSFKQMHPALMGVGIGCMIVSIYFCLYYIVIITWCVYYFFISLTKDLPWIRDELCPKAANYTGLQSNYTYYKDLVSNATVNSSEYFDFKHQRDSYKQQVENFTDCCVRDPSMWYFYSSTLQVSTDIDDYGEGVNAKLFGCLILAWFLTYICIAKGIKTSGKAVYFTATFPYVILFIFFFRGITLEGAADGIRVFFEPDFSKLSEPTVWKDAATQMFYSISVGFGAMITFASYNNFHNNVVRDALIVVTLDAATCVFAGVTVFSILGYRQHITGIPVTEVGGGPGLAFITFSDAFLRLDASPFWAAMLFLMLFLLGIDSEFGTMEAAITPIFDANILPKWMKKWMFTGIVAIALMLCALPFLTGKGYYIFQTFDDWSGSLPLVVIALFQCIAVAWVYGNDKFAEDIKLMTGKRPWIGWMVCWKYISPILLFLVLIGVLYTSSSETAQYSAFVGCAQDPYSHKFPGSDSWTTRLDYPAWAQGFIAIMVMLPILPIFICIIYYWPSNWRSAFYNKFCTGVTNYLPDPSRGGTQEYSMTHPPGENVNQSTVPVA